jgi:hypothetical protein
MTTVGYVGQPFQADSDVRVISWTGAGQCAEFGLATVLAVFRNKFTRSRIAVRLKA